MSKTKKLSSKVATGSFDFASAIRVPLLRYCNTLSRAIKSKTRHDVRRRMITILAIIDRGGDIGSGQFVEELSKAASDPELSAFEFDLWDEGGHPLLEHEAVRAMQTFTHDRIER